MDVLIFLLDSVLRIENIMIPYLFCLCVAGLIHFTIRNKQKQILELHQLSPLITTIFVYIVVKILEHGLIFAGLKNPEFEIVSPAYPLVIIVFLLGQIVFSKDDKK